MVLSHMQLPIFSALAMRRLKGNNKSGLELKNKKSAIHVARLTIHEVDVRNRPYFSDKLVEDWRWQKR